MAVLRSAVGKDNMMALHIARLSWTPDINYIKNNVEKLRKVYNFFYIKLIKADRFVIMKKLCRFYGNNFNKVNSNFSGHWFLINLVLPYYNRYLF